MSNARRVPMFPLGTPLLPGSLLPLHVFELRYQIMMDDVMAREPHEFGVVMIERGYEVGGGDVRAGIGTVALVARSEEVDDGRRMVLAVGTSRIRVVEWLADDPYPMALVDDWPIDEAHDEAHDLEKQLDEQVERFVALVRRFDERAPSIDTRADDERLIAYVYRLASSLPLGPADRQAILSASSSLDATRRLVTAIDDLDALVRFRAGLDASDG